jgi:hypothetical protein
MDEGEVEEPNFETQIEGFLTKELTPDAQERVSLKGKEIFKVAVERLDVPYNPLNEPHVKEEKISDDPKHLRRTYETDQNDTFFEAEIQDTDDGWVVEDRSLVRLGADALKSFNEEIGE